MFNINVAYTFTTLAPAILGNIYTNMTAKSIMDVNEAMKYSDVITQHESVKSTIPNLAPTPNGYTFILFVDAFGNQLVIANEYIDQATIKVETLVNLQVDIPNAPASLQASLHQYLTDLGVPPFTINVV